MFKIILVMFSGVAVGYLLRNAKGTERISTSTTVTIILLLFLMGCEIGSDDNVMRNLSSLGGARDSGRGGGGQSRSGPRGIFGHRQTERRRR